MKKRLISVLLVLAVLVLSLAGCGRDGKDTKAADKYLDMSLEELYWTQSIGTETLINARDLGGYTGAGGKTVKKGKILRSSRLCKASENDLEILTEKYHLCRIIDFRSTAEIEGQEDPVIAGAVYSRASFYDDEAHAVKSATFAAMLQDTEHLAAFCYDYIHTADYAESYLQKFEDEDSKKALHQTFRILLDEDNDGAVLFHCMSGKDRTGVAAILILEALGVDEEVILKDFEASNVAQAAEVKFLENLASEAGYTEEEVHTIGTMAGVSPELMRKTLDQIREKYGSIHDYLITGLGLTEKDLSELQEMYLE